MKIGFEIYEGMDPEEVSDDAALDIPESLVKATIGISCMSSSSLSMTINAWKFHILSVTHLRF